jgi:hypothetical protein
MVAHTKVQNTNDTPRPKGALSIAHFAAYYDISPTTVWRALKAGRLEYVLVGKKKLVLHPTPQRGGGAPKMGVVARQKSLEARQKVLVPAE